ncbi:uncharacterized protein LAESUDRAFT_731265 [Laetiporus sulphureus 93-53]|uniref:Nucleoporin Nup54 alpha-helical domain-containing protein n=1 Tax=Laetiporus sulphureus 93-53 TaxID=1314785 RepID=A0A165BP65_9APHY|nr:uncharacterized protein LAESUDRAFT_731265 [Laetiporus sulphureus 93-53]KZT01405.1 hypothetical protein LAESUDRAFT_731265 [Laetiporus sulphureus 93-53]
MAFPSSSSILSATPAAQPGTSLFGQITTNPQQGSPFGGASQSATSTFGSQPQAQGQAPAQGSSLFGSTLGQNAGQQQNQPQSGQTSLFGGFGQRQQQPQAQSTSLFGQPAANPQQQTQSTGLFGQSAVNPQQQTQPTGLFGQPAANTQQGGALGPSLFGSAQPQQSTQGGGLGTSLFGTTQTQQSAQAGGPFGFGASTGSTLGQTSGFGGWGAGPSQPQTTGMFGQNLGTSAAPAISLFNRPLAQQQPYPSVSGSAPPAFTRLTKFNDLPDDIKRTLETIDASIQGRIQISNDLKQRKLGEEAVKGQEEVRNVHKDLVGAIATLHSDVLHTKDLKAKVDQTVQDTIIATRIVDGFRNLHQHGAYLKAYTNFPLEFFTRVTEQMRERLRWYKTTIEHIERKLSSAAAQSQYTPQAISSTLEAQHATFIALASKTAALDAELQKIKALYTQLWRAKTNSMRDPFNELDRSTVGEFGLEGLSTR